MITWTMKRFWEASIYDACDARSRCCCWCKVCGVHKNDIVGFELALHVPPGCKEFWIPLQTGLGVSFTSETGTQGVELSEDNRVCRRAI